MCALPCVRPSARCVRILASNPCVRAQLRLCFLQPCCVLLRLPSLSSSTEIPAPCAAISCACSGSLSRPPARLERYSRARPSDPLQQTAARSAADSLPELSAYEVRSRTLRHHQLHAILREHTLLHGETLLVLSAQDLQDVASELLADVLAIHLSREPLVIERAPIGSEGIQLRRANQTDLLHCVRAANTGARAAGQGGAAHSFFSSSISMSFCLPVDGLAMLSCKAGTTRLSLSGRVGRAARQDAGTARYLHEAQAKRSGEQRRGGDGKSSQQ